MTGSRLAKWSAMLMTGSLWVLGAGSCLPDNFWPTFLGDTILTGVASSLLAAALAGAGL